MRFTPTICEAHRERVSELRTPLSAAMQASAVDAPSEAVLLEARRAELQGRVQELRRTAAMEAMVPAAAEINLLQTELGLVEERLSERQRAHATARQSQEAEVRSLCIGAVEVLSGVGVDFLEQHRAHLVESIADYGDRALATRLTGLIPWFQVYRNRIDNFRYQRSITPANDLLAYLDAALGGEDFLAPREARQA